MPTSPCPKPLKLQAKEPPPKAAETAGQRPTWPTPSLFVQDAAAVPTVFMTADAALLSVAKLTAGERVLLHAAAGGVGLAALQ
eukprot:362107-Chlamydomonas_euryale.AAC.12